MKAEHLKILAIDDNQDNLVALQAVLQDVLPQASLLTALNGSQGLAQARDKDPDVILLDIVMPGMDGFAVCRELKADERLRAIPVVFLTALKTGSESRVEALEVGAEGFLAKPLDETELVAQIRAMAKIKVANHLQRLEKEQLAALVAERTSELEKELAERVRAEEALREYSEQLEEMVAKRTAGLEIAIKEHEAFSYSVSHDLRAPLRGIDGWSHALLEEYGDQLDEQAHQYLDRVRSETRRMERLINDLLALSRLSRHQLRRQPVDLTALAQTIAARLQEAQPQRPVEFIIQEGLTAQCDAHLLEIALTNLLNNAFKFTGQRNPARIEFGQNSVGGQPAYFVRDNGVGFDMAYASKLFGAFQRLHSPAEFPGTGIGLATVQRIVRRHGGRVWAEAAVGKGATFYFTLKEK